MKTKFIYTLSDPLTKRVRYIGKTNNIKRRLSSHISNCSLATETKKNNWIISLLREGLIPTIEIIDELPENEINYYEIFYISLFKTWGFDLLNGTLGGDGFDWTGRKHNILSNEKNRMNSPHRKSVAQYTLDDVLIKEYYSLKQAQVETGTYKSHIAKVCNKIKSYQTAGGFKWKFIDKIIDGSFKQTKNRVVKYTKPRLDSRMKKVCVYNLDGELIDTCRSINIASKKHNCHKLLIKRCCDERGYYQTKNLTFRYFGDNFDYIPYKHYRKSKAYTIGIFSDSGVLLNEFNSLKDAVTFTGIGKQYISKNCKDNILSGTKSLKGKIFRFID